MMAIYVKLRIISNVIRCKNLVIFRAILSDNDIRYQVQTQTMFVKTVTCLVNYRQKYMSQLMVLITQATSEVLGEPAYLARAFAGGTNEVWSRPRVRPKVRLSSPTGWLCMRV